MIGFVTLINQGKYLELASWGKVKEYLYDHGDVLIYMMGNISTLLEAKRIKHDAYQEFSDKYGKWITNPVLESESDINESELVQDETN